MIDEQVKLDIMRALAEYYSEVEKLEKEVATLRTLVDECLSAFHRLDHNDGGPCVRCVMVDRIGNVLAEMGISDE